MERDVREPLTYRRLRANEVGTERQPSGPEIYAELTIDELATATELLPSCRAVDRPIFCVQCYSGGSVSKGHRQRAFRGDRR